MERKYERKIVRSAVTEMVAAMLERRMTMRWKGTKVDLLEMLHIAFVSQELKDCCGMPISYKTMVHNILPWQNVKVPVNPCNIFKIVREKKGVKSRPVADRLLTLMTARGMIPAGDYDDTMLPLGLCVDKMTELLRDMKLIY